jgi:hypothetical protein
MFYYPGRHAIEPISQRSPRYESAQNISETLLLSWPAAILLRTTTLSSMVLFWAKSVFFTTTKVATHSNNKNYCQKKPGITFIHGSSRHRILRARGRRERDGRRWRLTHSLSLVWHSTWKDPVAMILLLGSPMSTRNRKREKEKAFGVVAY